MDTDEAERRRREVHGWQRHYNMVPRHDSHLTELYVRGECDWSAEVVARELVATDFVYRASLYGETIEEFMRGVALRLKKAHNLTWSQTWPIVRFYAPMALKLICVDACGIAIPHRMPDAF